MKMEISFPGGVAVDAQYRGHTIRTDQPETAGGADAAPSPFDLFIASIGTCIGYYALQFCRSRELDTTGLSITLDAERDPDSKLITRIAARIEPPRDFPPKYLEALRRAADHCTVKRHLQNPPEIEVDVTSLASAGATAG